METYTEIVQRIANDNFGWQHSFLKIDDQDRADIYEAFLNHCRHDSLEEYFDDGLRDFLSSIYKGKTASQYDLLDLSDHHLSRYIETGWDDALLIAASFAEPNYEQGDKRSYEQAREDAIDTYHKFQNAQAPIARLKRYKTAANKQAGRVA